MGSAHSKEHRAGPGANKYKQSPRNRSIHKPQSSHKNRRSEKNQPRPIIRRVEGNARTTNGDDEGDYMTEFWRTAHHQQAQKLMIKYEDEARAQGLGRTDEYGRRTGPGQKGWIKDKRRMENAW